MTLQDLEMTRGRDYYFQLVFSENGSAINITDWTIYFTAKVKATDSDDNAVIKVDLTTHTDPTNGITVLHVSKEDTLVAGGKYLYDITAKTDTDDVLPPLMYGTLQINLNITGRGAD